jgi:acetyl coenzyme A synthetase (ADP forming)-like protein
VAEYPSEFEFDVLLRDGRAIRLRPIKPEDAPREHRFFQRVGPESVYRRFFQVKTDLTPDELRHFTNVDYEDRMAFVAIQDDEMVAVGRYDVLLDKSEGDKRVAEVAFLVQDDFQGRGVGSLLLQHLTVYARLQGITEFEAFVLDDNRAMMRIFRNSGYKLVRQLGEGVYRVEYPIEYSLEAREAEWEHEKRSVTASLMPMLHPKSIAVIGASRNDQSIGGRLFGNLLAHGFTGPVFPVNPNAAFVHAVKAYPSVMDIEESVDLAIITVPAQLTLDAVEACGRKGVRGVVVITAGFGETGEGGDTAERELVQMARRYGMRMIGPNCMGLVNTDEAVRLDGQFGPTFPPPGNVAMASQSGALGLAILKQAEDLNIGISTFVSLGNRADISHNDLLLYWEDDPMTDVIVLYAESFGNPRRFGRIARRVARNKPVVVVKSGRSRAGARAASSHTGSMASLDVAVDALFEQSGTIRTDTMVDLFNVTALLANQPLPQGNRVAIVTNAGGPAILAADALEANGLELPEFSDTLQSAIGEHLPPAAAVQNPVDMVAAAGPDEYAKTISAILPSGEIDALMVIHIPTGRDTSEDIAHAVHGVVAGQEEPVPVVAVFMAAEAASTAPLSTGEPRIPLYTYPESAARALGAAVEYTAWRDRPEGEFPQFDDIDRPTAEQIVRRAVVRLGDEGGWLEPEEITEILDAYGIRSARIAVARSEDEAASVADRFGGPIAMKVIAPSVLHKSDVGGVELDVVGEDEVRAAYRRVMSVSDDTEGVLIQDFVTGGHEVLVGMVEDPVFGPLVVFGLGGIYVELMQDVAFRINPLTDLDVESMIADVRTAKVLQGYRGSEPGDVPALEELLLRLSTLIDHIPEISEMDLNPVKVLAPGNGAIVVDARVKVRKVMGAMLPSRKDVPGRML